MCDFKSRDFLFSVRNRSPCLHENVKRRRLKVASLLKLYSEVISVSIATSSTAASVVSVSVLPGYTSKVVALGSWFLMRTLRTPIGRCTVLRPSSCHSHSRFALKKRVYAASILRIFLSLTCSMRIGIKERYAVIVQDTGKD